MSESSLKAQGWVRRRKNGLGENRQPSHCPFREMSKFLTRSNLTEGPKLASFKKR